MKKIAILIEPGSTTSSIMITLDMFRLAARLQPEEGYRLDLFSTNGGNVNLSEAVAVKTQLMPPSLADHDVAILPGFFANSVEHIVAQLETTWETVLARLGELDGRPLVAASCYGTFVLAEAGLLNNIQATTTWWMEQEFRQRYPAVLLDADKTLIDSGNVITAGAMTAHTDLSLHILRRLSGVAIARSVGSIMLVDGVKSSQRPFMTTQRSFQEPLIQKSIEWFLSKIGQPISIHDLANDMCVSYRTLNRRFLETTGRSPLAYLHELRIERAKELLECTEQVQEEITLAVGYEDLSSFRRLFKRSAGITPAQYRQQFRRVHS
jgi:transcriptional regulator GlxA family with amidase domain